MGSVTPVQIEGKSFALIIDANMPNWVAQLDRIMDRVLRQSEANSIPG